LKILLTGRNGQVGWELERTLTPLGEVIATDRSTLDLADPDAIRRVVREVKPEIIVNAAAYTAVDKAESEPELAMRINGLAPGVLAEEARRIEALLIHYSTDHVFDGAKDEPYTEDDPPNPLNAYGRSKLAGDRAVAAIGGAWLVFRTTWVYAERGNNFVRTILRLAKERENLRIVGDQFGSPTWARLIAEATAHVIRQAESERSAGTFTSGLYNLAASGWTSWHGFATAIIRHASNYARCAPINVRTIEQISTEAYPLPAARPKNSRLATERFVYRFDIKMPDWQSSLALCLEDLSCGTF